MPDPVQLITPALLDLATERALASPRLRMNHNFHHGNSANLQRFLNALIQGTYVTPHRHLAPPRPEALLVLRGAVALLLFDDGGRITHRYRLGDGGVPGVDIGPEIWHSIVVLSDSAILYEAKPGPYAPPTDEDFAPFAPREGDPASASYLAQLLEKAALCGQ